MNFQKMYLVEEQPVSSTVADPLQPTLVTTSFEPTLQIKKTTENSRNALVESSNLPDDIRVKLFSQSLQRQMALKQAPQWSAPPTPPIPDPQTTSMPNPTLDVVQNLPKSMHVKAKNLVDWMDRYSGRLSWNHLGQLVLDGSSIPKSNIVHLLHFVLSPRPSKTKDPPLAVEALARMFTEINVPENLIGNKSFIKMMRETLVSPRKKVSPLVEGMTRKRWLEHRRSSKKLDHMWQRIHNKHGVIKSWTKLV